MKLKFNYYSGWVGGWSGKTKLILISTLVEVVVEVEVELGKIGDLKMVKKCKMFLSSTVVDILFT